MLFSLFLHNPVLAVIIILAIIIVISVHEYAHALTGYLLGDHTAEDEGRLTLNPLAHLDPMGTLLLIFIGFGWGRPVPFNPYNLRWKKWGGAAVALAGPVSNFILAIVVAMVFRWLAPSLGPENYLAQLLIYIVLYAVVLGIFNLIPVPPLDGSKILFTLLPARLSYVAIWLERNGTFLLLALLIALNFTDNNLFDQLVSFVSRIFLGGA